MLSFCYVQDRNIHTSSVDHPVGETPKCVVCESQYVRMYTRKIRTRTETHEGRRACALGDAEVQLRQLN